MPIEFRCPNCNQQLRVPDTAGGKNAKCPKCATILAVPASSSAASPPAPLGPPPQPEFNFGAPAAPPPPTGQAGSLTYAGGGGSFGAPPPSSPFGPPPSPFGDAQSGANPFAMKPAESTATVNPYASPTGVYHVQQVAIGGAVGHQIVEVGPILNVSIKIWQDNLGMLIAMVLFPIVIILPLMLVLFGAMAAAEQLNAPILIPLVFLVVYFAIIGMSVYLNIGQSQMMLKMCRRQPVVLADMFPSFERFLPVLGFMILWNIIMTVALLMFVVPGIVLAFMLWPAQMLVIDGRCRVMDSFGEAYKITQGNHMTTFLLILVSMGFSTLGYMACGVGLLFAMPLIMICWNVAYLMMSEQMAVPGTHHQGGQQPQYR